MKLCKKFGQLEDTYEFFSGCPKILVILHISTEMFSSMLQKNLAVSEFLFDNFGQIIYGEKMYISSMVKKFRAVWKIRKIQIFKKIHCCPIFLWHSGKVLILQKEFWTFWEFLYCPITSGTLERLKKLFIYADLGHTEKKFDA